MKKKLKNQATGVWLIVGTAVLSVGSTWGTWCASWAVLEIGLVGGWIEALGLLLYVCAVTVGSLFGLLMGLLTLGMSWGWLTNWLEIVRGEDPSDIFS